MKNLLKYIEFGILIELSLLVLQSDSPNKKSRAYQEEGYIQKTEINYSAKSPERYKN